MIFNPFVGGGKAPAPAGRSDVNFFDYDGSIVASYTAADFAKLSALPKNPTHDGLTAQGWNYTLADAKAYVASYGKLGIGQMYITDDGKTRIYIKLEEGRLAPYLGIAINGTATVEWGDGQTSTVTGSSTTTDVSTRHTYANAGEYVIRIAVSGSMRLLGNSSYYSQVLWKNRTGSLTILENTVYRNAIQKVEIGANTSIGVYAFIFCYSLKSVTIPSSVTSIDSYAFRNCRMLKSVTIPSSVTSINDYAFAGCYSLKSVTIPSSVTKIGECAFQNCYPLKSVTIPSGVTGTNLGMGAVQGCSALTSVVIPSGVTEISKNLVNSCELLTSVNVPSSVTKIGYAAFRNCSTLTSIVIPDSVTSIDNAAFQNCYGLSFIKFVGTTPPTIPSSEAWLHVPTDCIIYVPRGSLSAYTTPEAQCPSASSYTYVEYDP